MLVYIRIKFDMELESVKNFIKTYFIDPTINFEMAAMKLHL